VKIRLHIYTVRITKQQTKNRHTTQTMRLDSVI